MRVPRRVPKRVKQVSRHVVGAKPLLAVARKIHYARARAVEVGGARRQFVGVRLAQKVAPLRGAVPPDAVRLEPPPRRLRQPNPLKLLLAVKQIHQVQQGKVCRRRAWSA